MLRFDRKKLSRWVIAALICALISFSFTFISLGETDTAVDTADDVALAAQESEAADDAQVVAVSDEKAADDAVEGEPVLTIGAISEDEDNVAEAYEAVGEEDAGPVIVAVVDGEEEEYAPQDYIDSYADLIGADENFDANLDAAITEVRKDVSAYATIWSLLPAVIAIVLALITKEVYSSLFIGILAGGVIYSFGSGSFWGGFEKTVTHTFSDGFITSVADSYNIGIIIFLVMLGALVAMMNKAGGSRAFGRWTTKHIKSRVGAQLMTILLGVLIFIDDYFNCLTVGSVMRPVTDEHNISRAKLAYLIDATAAPVCIIAPISSWAAAVAGFAKGAGAASGMSLFLSAIPFNFYAILTIVMMLFLAFSNFDYGPMKKHEDNAKNGDIFTTGVTEKVEEMQGSEKGKVVDLILPVVFLIIACVIGMIYSGGFFTAGEDGYHNFIEAFSNSDASVGLVYGSFAGIIFTVIYFLCRRVLSFKACMEAIPEGFKAMVPAIMILCCAWTLKTMTDSLGAKIFISDLVAGGAGAMQYFLPAIIFVIAVGLSFSTGTSWGTFGILIPIVLSVFGSESGTITIVAISACMAGAVCGDHCSPISDTTIMASAGAQCNHINHVSTQLPYALTVAGVSFVSYIVAGLFSSFGMAYLALPISIVLMIGTLAVLKMLNGKKA